MAFLRFKKSIVLGSSDGEYILWAYTLGSDEMPTLKSENALTWTNKKNIIIYFHKPKQ